MKITKFALPLLAAVTLAGCGNEVQIKSPKGSEDFKNAEMIVLQKQDNSVFNPEFLGALEKNLTLNSSIVVTNRFYKNDTNLRTAAITELESRIQFVNSLNVSEETKTTLLSQLTGILDHQKKQLAFEESITDADFWDYYGAKIPEDVALVKPMYNQTLQYNEYLKPHRESREAAARNNESARYGLMEAEDAVREKLVEYTNSYDLEFRPQSFHLSKQSYIYEPVNKTCKVEQGNYDTPMQTIYSDITKKCHYVVVEISKGGVRLEDKHFENLKEILSNNQTGLIQAEIKMAEASRISIDSEASLEAQEKIANKKFDKINDKHTDPKYSMAGLNIQSTSHWYFNSTDLQWGDKNDKGYALAMADLRTASGLNADYPQYKTDLSSEQLFKVYQEILNLEIAGASIHEVSEDGMADFEPNGDTIKLLVLSKDTEFRDYKLLLEEKNAEGALTLFAKGYGGRPLESQPLALRTQAQRSDSMSIERSTDAYVIMKNNELRSRYL